MCLGMSALLSEHAVCLTVTWMLSIAPIVEFSTIHVDLLNCFGPSVCGALIVLWYVAVRGAGG